MSEINGIDLSSYPPNDRATLEQALAAMRDVLRWDRAEIERITRRKWTTITRFYQGKPQGAVPEVIADIARLTNHASVSELIATPITKDYERVLNSVAKTGGMGLIVARNGRGKTLTARTWARRKRTGVEPILVQVPSRCTRDDLVRLLLREIGTNAEAMTQPERERELMTRVSSRHMLIVDEAGYLVQASRRTSPLRLLQDLHDMQACGVVLIMRPSQWDKLYSGRNYLDDEQLIGRLLHRSIITGEGSSYKREEVMAIVERYVPTITKQLRGMIRALLDSESGGLRALCEDLHKAARYSKDRSVPFEEALASMTALRDRSAHITNMEAF